jgi:hydroxymethylpyrimidine/phosphomethylpyrimidine kinase
MEACGVFGTSVLCATTAQNTRGVESVHVLPTTEIGAQLGSVLADFDVGAAKTGMLATAEVVAFVAERARRFPFPLVVDPVMVATSGDRLLEPEGEDAYEELIAEATVVTPNADEATVLTGIEIEGEDSAVAAGEALCDMGADAALVKGGHVGGERVTDVLVTEEGTTTITHPRVDTDATHGSGCTLASAIAASLARGEHLDEAVTAGVDLLSRAIRYPREASAALPDPVTVAGATPYAEHASEITVVEGIGTVGAAHDPTGTEPAFAAGPDAETKKSAVGAGERPNSADADAAGSAVDRTAEFLLAARDRAPELRFVLGCRLDDGIERALDTLNGPVVETESRLGDDPTGNSAGTSETPVAAVERSDRDRGAGETGWIVATDPAVLVERTIEVSEALEATERD